MARKNDLGRSLVIRKYFILIVGNECISDRLISNDLN